MSCWSAHSTRRTFTISAFCVHRPSGLTPAWPRDSRADRSRFEKLKEAYVKARYSKHYRISEEELAWLGERVEVLGQAVQVICEERIAALARSAAA